MDEIKWKPGGKKHVLQTYTSLHKHKLFGEHWAWVALERMAAGENEAEVMRDYGYALVPPGWQVVPREPTEEMEGAGWDVEELRTPDRIYVAMLNAAPEAATMGLAGIIGESHTSDGLGAVVSAPTFGEQK